MKLHKTLRQRLQNYSVITSHPEDSFACLNIIQQGSYTEKLITAASLNRVHGGTAASVTNLQDSELQDGLREHQTSQWSTSLPTLVDQPPSSITYQMILGGIACSLALATWANFAQIDEVGQAK